MSELADTLAGLQLSATVEQRQRMAILRPADAQALEAIGQWRAQLLARAADLRVSHLAVEVPELP